MLNPNFLRIFTENSIGDIAGIMRKQLQLYLGSGAFNNRNKTPETPIQKSQYIAGCLSSDFIIIPLSSNSADSKTRIKAIKLDFVAFAQYQIHDIELILSSGTRPKAFTAASMDSFEKRDASCSPRPQGVSTHIGTGNQKLYTPKKLSYLKPQILKEKKIIKV